MTSFRSEHDEFQESTFESDSDAFIAFVVATPPAPGQCYATLVTGFLRFPALYGKAFVIELDHKTASVIDIKRPKPFSQQVIVHKKSAVSKWIIALFLCPVVTSFHAENMSNDTLFLNIDS